MARMLLRRTSTAAILVLGTLSSAGVATAQDLSPGLVTAIQRALGLTAHQAEPRVAQELAATKLVPAAQEAAGAAFGGTWFDPSLGKLVVGLTDQRNAAAVH